MYNDLHSINTRRENSLNDLLTISNYLLNNYTQLLVIIFQIYFPMHLSPK